MLQSLQVEWKVSPADDLHASHLLSYLYIGIGKQEHRLWFGCGYPLVREFAQQVADIFLLLPPLRELGVAFVAYSPLGRGIFGGRIKNLNDLAEGDYRRSAPRFAEGNLASNLSRMDAAFPAGAAKGERYSEQAMRALNG